MDLPAHILDLLSCSLAGKQIWHITAPASVPLSSIKEVNIDAVKSGDLIMVHNDRHYGFTNSPEDSQDLLLPENNGSSYKRSKTSTSRIYHLREIPNYSQPTKSGNLQLPEAEKFFAKAIPDAKPHPKQPNMLRTRYKPFGTGTDDSRDHFTRVVEDLAREGLDFQPPPQVESPLRGNTPRSKKKKRNRPGSTEQDGLAEDEMEIDASPVHETIMDKSSSQVSASVPEMPNRSDGLEKTLATPKEKKKKKKKRHREELSS
jgi:DNA-directed RNA polymerase I subunit RPA34.5